MDYFLESHLELPSLVTRHLSLILIPEPHWFKELRRFDVNTAPAYSNCPILQ